MGVSTDGQLFYGILLEEGAEIHPKALNGEGICPGTWNEYDRDDFVETPGCGIVCHCSLDYPMYALILTETLVTASRGYPEAIEALTLPDNADEMLRAYCEELGVEYTQPQWWVASLWS